MTVYIHIVLTTIVVCLAIDVAFIPVSPILKYLIMAAFLFLSGWEAARRYYDTH